MYISIYGTWIGTCRKIWNIYMLHASKNMRKEIPARSCAILVKRNMRTPKLRGSENHSMAHMAVFSVPYVTPLVMLR